MTRETHTVNELGGREILGLVIETGLSALRASHAVELEPVQGTAGDHAASLRVRMGNVAVAATRRARDIEVDEAAVSSVLSHLLTAEDLQDLIAHRLDDVDFERARELKRFLRARELRRQLLTEEGGCHTAQVIADAFGVTRSAIHQQEKAGKVFCVREGTQKLFPIWQYRDDGVPYKGIETVLCHYDPVNKFELLAWFLNDSEVVADARPIDLLRSGDLEALSMAGAGESAAQSA